MLGVYLYVPFEKFIAEEDQDIFYQKLHACNGERFMMRLAGENGDGKIYLY